METIQNSIALKQANNKGVKLVRFGTIQNNIALKQNMVCY
ncbi:hypothetical protein HMPREF1244_1799 [Streptococcus pyogenes GA19702]|nr:hypothetical protein HMPREF1244_1799 [Streptococcus pyogenes GA19702]